MDNYTLTKEQIEKFSEDGFVIVRGLFEKSELEPLQRAYSKDPTINGSAFGMVGESGIPHPINIWTECGDDIVGMIPRMDRTVDAVETLLGEACYHWHSKITVKPPHCPAPIGWHQDFGAWYEDGVLFPRMLSMGLAVEPATRAKGCLQVVPGSQRMGRIDHRANGNGPNTLSVRVDEAKSVLGLKYCELDVGDAVFFDCNTLHGSGSNETDTARLMLFCSYNAVSNEPVAGAQGSNEEGAFMNITQSERAFRELKRVPDDALATNSFKSAFHHTNFKIPRTDLSGTSVTAAKL